MIENTFHSSFKLNGIAFNSAQELLVYAKKTDKDVFSFFKQWFDSNDFVKVHTSGSTGKPTLIKLKKEYMKNSALATGTFFNLFAGTKSLLCLSSEYIAGKMMLVRALVLGWELDIITASSKPLEAIKEAYDFCAMVPLQLANSINKLDKIKILIVGGGNVSNELIANIQNATTKVYATYGMTETITHIAIKKLNHYEFNKTQYFRVLPNIKISKDTRGCLIINAPKISDKKVVTNDLVKIISETEFKWLGRHDYIINSGGVKLLPEQIEEKITQFIEERFFVAGIPDDVLGEKLILIIESKNENSTILKKIKNLSTLTKYEIPKEVYFLLNFIETETKKIQRRKTLDLIFR